MFGIIIEVTVDPAREDEARRMLHERIVPKAKSHAGFLSGQWLRAVDGDVLRSVHIFDSEDNAQAAASQIRAEGPRLGPPVGVTLQAVDAYEVIATA